MDVLFVTECNHKVCLSMPDVSGIFPFFSPFTHLLISLQIGEKTFILCGNATIKKMKPKYSHNSIFLFFTFIVESFFIQMSNDDSKVQQ